MITAGFKRFAAHAVLITLFLCAVPSASLRAEEVGLTFFGWSDRHVQADGDGKHLLPAIPYDYKTRSWVGKPGKMLDVAMPRPRENASRPEAPPNEGQWPKASAANSQAADAFRRLADNRVAVRTSLGLRSAAAVDATHAEMVLGISVTPACARAASYRIVSFQDDAYAYEKFVMPLAASARTELEVEGPLGCPFPRFQRTIVRLELPHPLKEGVEYFIVAQGSGQEMVTGGHTAQALVFRKGKPAAPSDHDVDLAVLGLRQIEPVGPRIIKVEFGPNFSADAAGRVENYRIRIAGTAAKVVRLGRITKVDTYLPTGWPFAAIPMHEVFLELDRPLVEGKDVDVEVARAVTTAAGAASLRFASRGSLSNSLKVNQVGYLTDSPVKIAYLGRWMGSFPENRSSPAGRDALSGSALAFADPPEFCVCRESDATTVFRGQTKLVHRAGEANEGVYKVDHSGETVYLLDFTAMKTPGRYFVSVADVGRSLPFAVGDDVYKSAFEVQASGVFVQRCGMAMGPPYTEWRRIACHRKGLTLTTQDKNEPHDIRDLSRKVVRRPAGGAAPGSAEAPVVIAAYGGHHDAGDYNPRSHLDVARTLMDAYEMAPRKFFDGQLNIPERGNGVPDILDEAHWALRLWLDLQDEDGGVYGGTESAGDPNFFQTVELDPCGDYAYAKDAAGSYWFAGAMAQASRLWRAIGKSQDADAFLARARRAYRWAEEHPLQAKSPQQEAVERLDPKAYAAAQLLHTTGEARFNKDFLGVCAWPKKPDAEVEVYGQYDQSLAAWAYVNCPAAVTDPAIRDAARKAILQRADLEIRFCQTMAYGFIRHPWAPINWGTGAYENHLPPVIWAYMLTGDEKYRTWIVRTCDNTLGANPLNRSYVAGLGTRTVRAPLHNSRYCHLGEVVAGIQVEGPVQKGDGYRVTETAYPPIRPDFASLHTFVDCHFAIAMDEGLVSSQAKTMAAFGLLLPDSLPPSPKPQRKP